MRTTRYHIEHTSDENVEVVLDIIPMDPVVVSWISIMTRRGLYLNRGTLPLQWSWWCSESSTLEPY